MKVALELGCPKHKALVHYLGVPTFPKVIQYTPKNAFRFVMVARMVPVKNHLNVVRAFAQVCKSTLINMELVFIGSGELQKKIEKEVANLKMDKKIIFHGDLSNKEVIGEVSKSQCIVLVSKIHSVKRKMNQQEGLPIALLEGASLGLPMIGSNTGGIPEVVINDFNGYLVNSLDILDIKNAMLKVAENPEKTKEMGRNARDLVHEKFNITEQMKHLEEIFLGMLN